MYTVAYRRQLKLIKDINDSLHPGGQLGQEYSIPLERLPKRLAPQYCQSLRVFALRDSPSEKQTQDHFFEKITLPPEHPMFTSGRSLISPISKAIGIPLIVYLEAPLGHPFMRRERGEYMNHTVRSLLINTKTGHPNWEHFEGLGTALVARFDNRPLSTGLLTTIHAYVTMLEKERYNPIGDNTGNIKVHAGVQYTITPSDFAKFSRKFIDRTKRSFHSE